METGKTTEFVKILPVFPEKSKHIAAQNEIVFFKFFRQIFKTKIKRQNAEKS
jgi:hypothetical protein